VAYVFDIYDLKQAAQFIDERRAGYEDIESIEPGQAVLTETWQRYLEETLWDYGLNVVRTARFHDQTYPYVRYLKWKLDHTPLIRGLIPWRELNATHGPDQCYVYIRGDTLLLAYY